MNKEKLLELLKEHIERDYYLETFISEFRLIFHPLTKKQIMIFTKKGKFSEDLLATIVFDEKEVVVNISENDGIYYQHLYAIIEDIKTIL